MKAHLLRHYWEVFVLVAGTLLVLAAPMVRADSTLVDTFSRSVVPTFDLGVSEDLNHYLWTAVGDSAYGTSIIDDGQPGNPYLFCDSGWTGFGVCPEAFTCADFDITWDYKISTGTEAGVIYRADAPGVFASNNPTDYLAHIHNGADGPAIYLNGAYIASHFGTGIDFSQWTKCRLKVVGNHHQMWCVNVADTDTPLIDFTDTANAYPQGPGYISLGRGFGPGSTQDWDNVTIKNLDQYSDISGTVTKKGTTTAISGVTLMIDKLPVKTATSDANGKFTILGVRYGAYQKMKAVADNYYPYVAPVTVPAGTPLTYNVEMIPLGSPYATVTDNFGRTSSSLGVTEDALHVPWVDVAPAYPGRVANPAMIFDTATQAQGAALSSSFSPANIDLTVTIATDRSFICYRSSSQDGLDPSGYRVYLDSTSSPAYVELWHNNATVVHVDLPDGLNWSGGVPVHVKAIGARHQVWVNGVLYVDYVDDTPTANNSPGVIAFRKSAAANNGLMVSALKIDAYPIALSAQVSGTVKDSGGHPIQGAEVAFVAGYGFTSTTTAADGTYKIANVVPTSGITIQASKPGFFALYRTINLGESANDTGEDFTLATLPAGVIYDTFNRADGSVIGSTEDPSHITWLRGDPTVDHETLLNHRVWMPAPSYAGIGLNGVVASDVEVWADCLVSDVSAYGFGIMIRQHTGTPGQPVDWDDHADSFNYAGGYQADMVNAGGIQYIGGVYSGPAKPTDWTVPHRYHVMVQGSTVNADVDGIPWITAATTPSVGPGYISILRRGGQCWVDNVVIKIYDTPVATPGAAKSLADSSECCVQSAVVTGVFNGFFYIEDPSRSSGIKVISTATVNLNDNVAVSGIISTDANGERILTGNPFTIASAVTPIVALHMNGRAAIAASGLPAAGLLATIAGKVSNLSGGSFTVNDGSDATGIKVNVPSGVTLPGNLSNGSNVVVTGCAGKDTGPVPCLWIRTADDLTVE